MVLVTQEFLTSLIGHFGYFILFIVAALESIPFLGMIIPGQTILILGGFFAKAKLFHLGYLIIAASLGVIVGEIIAYSLGRFYGYGFLKKYGKYVLLKPETLDRLKELVKNHAGKTILFGRFNSLTRSFSAFVTGASHVAFYRFLFFSVFGGAIWAAGSIFLGFIFGKGFEIIIHYFGSYFTTAIILLGAIGYFYYLAYKKEKPFYKKHFALLTVCVVVFVLFLKILKGINEGLIIRPLDHFVESVIPSIWHPVLTSVMIFFTNLGEPIVLTFFAVFLFVILLHHKKIDYAIVLGTSTAMGLLFQFLIKSAVHRARPSPSLVLTSGYSFPSGHVTMSIIFFIVLFFAYKGLFKTPRAKFWFGAICFLFPFLICASRVYLHVHWFSDVLGGLFLGTFCATFSILALEVFLRTRKKEVVIKDNTIKE